MAKSREELKGSTAIPSDPRGVRIDGYWGPGLPRPGVGKLVQRSGEPQFCASVVFRLFAYDEGPHKIDPNKVSTRFSGDFMCVGYDGKKTYATDGYLPSTIVRGAKGRIDRGDIVSGAGDLWCEPAEKSPIGYAFTFYDRRPRGEADPLMELAVAAGIIEPLALPQPQRGPQPEIDPETGEVIESPEHREAAE